MPKRFFCLVVSLCLCSCAEIVLLATSAQQPTPPATDAPTPQNKEGGVPVLVKLRDPAGKPVKGAIVYAYPDGQQRLAKELPDGEYQFDILPVGHPISFEAYKDGQVTGAAFAPAQDAPNTLDMQFK